MDLIKYKVIVQSKLYKTYYTIRASNLRDASTKAKQKFLSKYKVDPAELKVAIQPCDIKNHIDEIIYVLKDSSKLL